MLVSTLFLLFICLECENKYILVNNDFDIKEIKWDIGSLTQINSLCFNKNIIVIAKNNGDAYFTTGSKEFPKEFEKSYYSIDKYIIADYDKIDNLLNSTIKIQSNLNKKYIKSISCGESHVLFLTQAGMVFSLGNGEKGQLGMNKSSNVEPEIISSLLNYRASSIYSGSNHNMLIVTSRESSESNNSVIIFGDNSKGQLGIKNNLIVFIPTVNHIFDKEELVQISLGENISCALNKLGEQFIFGALTSFETRKKSYNINNEFMSNQFIYDFPIKLQENILNDTEFTTYKNIACSNTSFYALCNDDKTILVINNKSFYALSIENMNNEIFNNCIFNDNQVIVMTISNDSSIKSSSESNYVIREIQTRDSHDKVILNLEPEIKLNNDFTISNSIISESLINLSDSSIDDNLRAVEELRSYISIVGMSYIGSNEIHDSQLSFRPKNLPKKSKEEEDYHRKLVEDNRKKYQEQLNQKKKDDLKRKEIIEKRRIRNFELEKYWVSEIIPNWHKLKNKNTIRKYFYQGIPTPIRGKIWLLCLGNHFSITNEYYEIEVKKAIELLVISNENDHDKLTNTDDIEYETKKYNILKINKENSIKQIDLDISRTFPYLGLYKQGSPLAEDLREVLRAFVVSRPDIGYIQGLSFIAGLLLIYMSKFQSFVALLNLVLHSSIISFYRFDEQQIKNRLLIFKQVFFFNLPELCDHFESLDLLPEYYLIEWCMTLFSKNLNIDLAARVWDIYMIDGIKAIYQAGIVILSHFEKKFMDSDFGEILKEIKSIQYINFDEDQLVSLMNSVKFPEWIEYEITKLNDDYIPINN